jgi:rod shape-determining protein MreD
LRILAQVAAYFVLAVLLGALWRITPFEVVAPDVALLFVLYIGITAARATLPEATFAALVIGYLHDVLAGAPRGAGAIVLGAVCILCRLATARLLVRGRLFIGGFAFVGSLAAALGTVFVRVTFDAPVGGFGAELITALEAAAMTALFAPPVLRLCRWIDAKLARTQREREALREGYLG